MEKAYALTGVGEDDYEGRDGEEGELSRETIEAELARRNVWRDGGEVGGWFGWLLGCVAVVVGLEWLTDIDVRITILCNTVLGARPRGLHARGDPRAQVRWFRVFVSSVV